MSSGWLQKWSINCSFNWLFPWRYSSNLDVFWISWWSKCYMPLFSARLLGIRYLQITVLMWFNKTNTHKLLKHRNLNLLIFFKSVKKMCQCQDYLDLQQEEATHKTSHMHYKKYFYPAGKLNRLKDMLSTIFRELFVSPHNQRQELLFPMFLP